MSQNTSNKPLTAKGQLLADLFAERIVFLDGAMGTMIQQYKLEEQDFRNASFDQPTAPAHSRPTSTVRNTAPPVTTNCIKPTTSKLKTSSQAAWICSCQKPFLIRSTSRPACTRSKISSTHRKRVYR